MPRTIRAAAVQLRAHDRGSFEKVWPSIAVRVREAAGTGAQLVVLPEGTLPAYVLGHERFEQAQIEPALAHCREIARAHSSVIVIGAARRQGERVFNTALIVDSDGSIAGTADKQFLWHFDRQWFSPGERLEPVQTSLGAIGALVCADGRIPTIAGALADKGADVLVMPTAWVTSGRDPHDLENVQADLLARVRARENGVPFVAANKCGVELGCVAYCGKSQIVRRDGTAAACASQDRPETIVAEIEIGAPANRRTNAAAFVPAPIESRAARIALTPRTGLHDSDERMRIVQADLLLAPDRPHANTAGDETVLDPAGLVAARLAGMDLVVWSTSHDPQWQVTIARARALELRMYVVVIDAAHDRAYAVDPDGSVLCGTFGGYDMASFAYDPARARQTIVAPETDVREGLQSAHRHAAR